MPDEGHVALSDEIVVSTDVYVAIATSTLVVRPLETGFIGGRKEIVGCRFCLFFSSFSLRIVSSGVHDLRCEAHTR